MNILFDTVESNDANEYEYVCNWDNFCAVVEKIINDSFTLDETFHIYWGENFCLCHDSSRD